MQGTHHGLPVQYFDDCAVVSFPAEVDIANAPGIREQLLVLLGQGVPGLIVDMTDTTFCDSTGLGVVVSARNRAEATDTWLRLVIPEGEANKMVRKTFHITHMDTLFDLSPTLAEARAQTLAR